MFNFLNILIVTVTMTSTGCDVMNPKLLLFLLDGVRWDYFSRDLGNLTGFRRIMERGIQVESMVPEYPSISYPNHYSLMTGLHAQDHGIVDNEMFDRKTGQFYPVKSGFEKEKSFWFNQAEPFWITATKQGKQAYMYNWVGCDVEIKGTRPHHCRPYSPVKKLKYFRQDIDRGLSALINGTADVVGIYHEGIDDMGHRFGPDSPEVKAWLRQVDHEFDRLLTKMTKLGVVDDVNMMVFSDHGMTDVHLKRVVNISSVLPMNNITTVINAYGSRVSIWPKYEYEQRKAMFMMLKNYDRHMKVYLKEDLPTRWFYTNNSRIAPLILVADLGWYIDTPGFGFYEYEETGIMKGEHGYDPIQKDMHGIFLAMGPNFGVNILAPSIRNIDLYQMMCDILNVACLSNHGDPENVAAFYFSSAASHSRVCGILVTLLYFVL